MWSSEERSPAKTKNKKNSPQLLWAFEGCFTKCYLFLYHRPATGCWLCSYFQHHAGLQLYTFTHLHMAAFQHNHSQTDVHDPVVESNF